MSKAWLFKLRVDGGDEYEILSDESRYWLVVMRAFGMLGLPFPCVVEIWCPAVMPDYGPYFYYIGPWRDCEGREYGTPGVMSIAAGKAKDMIAAQAKGDAA